MVVLKTGLFSLMLHIISQLFKTKTAWPEDSLVLLVNRFADVKAWITSYWGKAPLKLLMISARYYHWKDCKNSAFQFMGEKMCHREACWGDSFIL